MKSLRRPINDYTQQLRSLEYKLEAALEQKDWDKIMVVNQDLQNCCVQLVEEGYLEQPGIQQSLYRIQELCSHLISICEQHRAESLAAIKKNKKESAALSSYKLASSLGE